MVTLSEWKQMIQLYRLAVHRLSSSSTTRLRCTGTWATSKSNPNPETVNVDQAHRDSTFSDNDANSQPSQPSTSFEITASGQEQQEKNPWVGKIIFNTYLNTLDSRPRGYRQRLERVRMLPELEVQETIQAHQNSIPIALQMVFKDMGVKAPEKLITEQKNDETSQISKAEELGLRRAQFPYRLLTTMEFTPESAAKNAKKEDTDLHEQPFETQEHRRRRTTRTTTPTEDENTESDIDYEWYKDYGTPDSSVPASNVPCGGCGAILHCQDTSIPGYMPSERFKWMTPEDLITEICQRCYFLKEHHAALNVNLSKDDYPKLLSQIKGKFALELLMVDLLDFPCSIWPGIIDIIGKDRPVILVANKVDLLPQDSPKFLNQVKKCLMKSCQEVGLDQANVIHLELVSATTGYGIEQLIDAVFNLWGSKGDIYIMGCTNVGKSSLFNAFLQSDLCKIRVVDIIQRATISQWPGTTLNLLKFPVTRPSSERLGIRSSRLRAEAAEFSPAAHRHLRKLRVQDNRTLVSSTLIGHIGRSFVDKEKLKKVEEMNLTHKDLFSMPTSSPKVTRPQVINKMKSREELEEEFKASKWCYDTPGVVADNQILDQLTLPELMKTLPKQIIEPRTYALKKGWTLFVAGLSRIDVLKCGVGDLKLTVFTSTQLPITIVQTEDADAVYKEGLGSIVFGVPLGDENRLVQFPPLKGIEFELDGDGHRCSCADIVISTTGWVAITGALGEEILLKAFTPGGKGLFCRRPSLLPFSVNLKGKRIRGTPAYNPTRVFVEQ